LPWFEKFAFDYYFHPVTTFIGFFFGYAQLRDELSLRSSPTGGAIVCSNRRTGSYKLAAYRSLPATVFGKAATSFRILSANCLVRFFKSSAFMAMRENNHARFRKTNWKLAIGNRKFSSFRT
jgi:hypothetical protein